MNQMESKLEVKNKKWSLSYKEKNQIS
jgi:hypothetical protein